jgi:hypothetical protein
MTYDAKCFALATAFMADHPHLTNRDARTNQLAQEIQTAIDDVIDEFSDADSARDAMLMRREYDARVEMDAEQRHQRDAIERIYEAADMERKRIREEGK